MHTQTDPFLSLLRRVRSPSHIGPVWSCRARCVHVGPVWSGTLSRWPGLVCCLFPSARSGNGAFSRWPGPIRCSIPSVGPVTLPVLSPVGPIISDGPVLPTADGPIRSRSNFWVSWTGPLVRIRSGARPSKQQIERTIISYHKINTRYMHVPSGATTPCPSSSMLTNTAIPPALFKICFLHTPSRICKRAERLHKPAASNQKRPNNRRATAC